MAARARSRFDRDDDASPKSDVYTGLLALSLIAMIVSCLLLYLDFSQYGAMKAPAVSIPQPKGREGVQTGQLPPLINLPPPEPVEPRPFTRTKETAAAQPVKPVGGEEAQAPPTIHVPVPEPLPPAAVVEVPPPAPAPVEAPAPEPVVAPPVPAASTPIAPPPLPVPPPPPLPKSIRSLPN
jgi:hypothetical protein